MIDKIEMQILPDSRIVGKATASKPDVPPIGRLYIYGESPPDVVTSLVIIRFNTPEDIDEVVRQLVNLKHRMR